MIQLTVDTSEENTLNVQLDEEDGISLNVDSVVNGGVSSDYNDLANKPYLNDVVISGRMYESDPTVPLWAKATTKPSYSANEVNAVSVDDVVPLRDIDNILNTLWN